VKPGGNLPTLQIIAGDIDFVNIEINII